MEKTEVREYIHKHKDKYKLKALEKTLIKHGANKSHVEEVIKKLPPSYKVGRNQHHNHGKSILLILGCLIIISLFILYLIL